MADSADPEASIWPSAEKESVWTRSGCADTCQRGEGQGVDVVALAAELLHPLPGFGLPDKRGALAAAGGDEPAVRGIGHCGDALLADVEDVQDLAGSDVPEADHGLVTREQPVALRREGDAVYLAAVPSEGAVLPAGGGVPEEDVARHPRPGQQLAVRREGDGVHAAFRCQDVADLLARRRVPPADDSVPAGGGEELAVRREGYAAERGAVPQAQRPKPEDGVVGKRFAVSVNPRFERAGAGGWVRRRRRGRGRAGLRLGQQARGGDQAHAYQQERGGDLQPARGRCSQHAFRQQGRRAGGPPACRER
jgi:hypothetical protein